MKDEHAQVETRSLPTLTHCFPRSFTLITRNCPVLAPATLAALPSTRAIPDRSVGCHNKLMAMLDSDTGKIIATVPIGAGVDACAFDDATQLAFASCGDGTLTIAKEETPDKLTVVQILTTERGARTMALDPVTHRIYVATAEIAPERGNPSPSPGERRRSDYVPGTFHVLVYGTNESKAL